MNRTVRRVFQFILIAATVVATIGIIRHYGVDAEVIRDKVRALGIWAPLALFGLRFVSVAIPIIPGTAFALTAGLTLGLSWGLAVIMTADFLSCSLSFGLSRYYGRDLVTKLIGERFMSRVDQLGQRHLEQNFPLLTAFLMTGFFDFVSYGVGLTTTAWSRFLGALLISIPIAHTPGVIVGAKILEKQQSVWFVLIPLIIAFAIALLTGILQHKTANAQD